MALVGGRIYRRQAPQTTSYPLVVCGNLASKNLIGVGGLRLYSTAEWLVRGIVADEDQATLAAIAHRIDAALDTREAPVAVSFNGESYELRAVCLEDHEDTGTEEGHRYDSLGGRFQLFIESV